MRKIPRRPENFPEIAITCLKALVDASLASKIVLSGGLGLLHYLDFRSTVDLDAWWEGNIPAEEQHKVIDTIENTLKLWPG